MWGTIHSMGRHGRDGQHFPIIVYILTWHNAYTLEPDSYALKSLKTDDLELLNKPCSSLIISSSSVYNNIFISHFWWSYGDY